MKKEAGEAKRIHSYFSLLFSHKNWRGVVFKTSLIFHSYELLTERIIAEEFGNRQKNAQKFLSDRVTRTLF
jgi:IS1 family transposase